MPLNPNGPVPLFSEERRHLSRDLAGAEPITSTTMRPLCAMTRWWRGLPIPTSRSDDRHYTPQLSIAPVRKSCRWCIDRALRAPVGNYLIPLRDLASRATADETGAANRYSTLGFQPMNHSTPPRVAYEY